MPTRRIIRISPEEALARQTSVAAAKASSSPSAAVESLNTKKGAESKASICNHPNCTRRAQHNSPLCWKHCATAHDVTCSFIGCNKKGILLGLCPDHGGLVQLCRWKGCINVVDLDKRGGLCRLHRVKGNERQHHDEDDASSEDEGMEEEIRLCYFRGCISNSITDEGLCDRHLKRDKVMGKKKRALSSGDSIKVKNVKKKRQKVHEFFFDLADVPHQQPIYKTKGRVKDGASKYTGVSWGKASNKWKAQIMIDGKQLCIGHYDNEKDAAIDYARALFKYKNGVEQNPLTHSSDVTPHANSGRQVQGSVSKKRRKRKRQSSRSPFFEDLKDVPLQPLILKNELSIGKKYSDNTRRRNVREGSSKYTGVYFEKAMKKWKAQIMIDGVVRAIGYYEIEEEAAADYARAVFKYKPVIKSNNIYGGFDLTCIPEQPVIRNDKAASGYKGVKKNKSRWQASVNGKHLGTFDTKEEAARIYARALYCRDLKQHANEAATEESIDSVSI